MLNDINYSRAAHHRNKQYKFAGIEISHFKEPGNFFRMGRSPVQIDIISEASGITIKDCYQRRLMIDVEGIPIAVTLLGP